MLTPQSYRSKNVKRFIYMSSAQAMLGNEDLFHVYTEVRHDLCLDARNASVDVLGLVLRRRG